MTSEALEDMLPLCDVEYLREKGLLDRVVVSRVGQETHVVFKNYALPEEHYSPSVIDLLVKLIPPYPNGNPDMFWTLPHVRLKNGAMPVQSEVLQVPAPSGFEAAYSNVQWQRWSRHFNDSALWRPGIDGLRTYMASIRVELAKGR
jgi:Prokaryotic E2 family E